MVTPIDVDTLVDLLEWRAERTPSLQGFTFLEDGEEEQGSLTCADLAQQARAVAAWLQASGVRGGERVLLLFPQGLPFIAAFFGCAYAGATSIPAPMPHPARLARTLPRVLSMLSDAAPFAVLTNGEGLALAAEVAAHLPELSRSLRWLALEDCPLDLGSAWQRPPLSGDLPAHLQYTSGSTASPKGTVITHANVIHNSRAIQVGWRYSPERKSVVWVPHFHDDGLVQGLLQPIYTGYPCVLMPAASFVARPERWLRAISRHRATHGGGPNFAYELCLRKVTDAQREGLDLSSWIFAYNAAEPVRAETLRRFHERFGPRGFRFESFAPCFGLAEATLLVSVGQRVDGPRLVAVDSAALERAGVVRVVPEDTPGARTLVGCGPPVHETEVVILDPERGVPVAPDRIGEVLVKSPSIAAGYLDRPEESERVFRARLAGSGDGPYLRTGDQGFLLDGELFITGRIKDLLIIRGENRYPQDIEWSVERAHPAVAPGSIATFSFDTQGEERLVVVAEVKIPASAPAEGALLPLFDAIREAIFQEHDLRPWAIALLPPGAMPKTSSGKIQRSACKAAFRGGTLHEIARWTAPPVEPLVAAAPPVEPPTQAAMPDAPSVQGKSAAEIQQWLSRYLSTELGVRPDDIGLDVPFSRVGLDSASSVRLAADLSDWLGTQLPPIVAWNHPNLRALSLHLAGEEAAPSPRAARRSSSEPIAIVGAACRFPGGVRDLEGFWALLEQGMDAIGEVPGERWDINAYYDPNLDAPGKMITRCGGFLQGVDQFDPGFFEISPREAAEMDPQQRLLLEVSWEALERAGQPRARLAGSDTGVYIGISSNEYQTMAMASEGALGPHLFLGTAHSTGVGRLSYVLGLHGPNLPVDTACSSSLTAVHLACQALRHGECTMALAGGVNLILSPEATICLSQMRALSPTGRCRAFAADADGYVRSEGCGVVVLKRLSDAERDGDPILALLRGSALNQDGRSNGLTAPNGTAQQDVIRRALADAGVSPAAVGYVETHGTGTPLGDPIEAQALAAVLGEERTPEQPIVIGTVKSNIGHAESAAGVAGLLKAVLAVSRGTIPRSLHLKAPNPHLPWPALPLRLATEEMPWPPSGGPRIAGVSSFGMSGTNAHVILEEVPHRAPRAPEREASSVLLTLSAKTLEALSSLAAAYGPFLAGTAASLHDIAYTASIRRTHHEHRLAVAGRSKGEIAAALEAYGRGEHPGGLVTGKVAGSAPKVVFVCSGQGSQWAGMGHHLFQEEPIFREAIAACDKALQHHTGFSVVEEIARPEPSSRLGETEIVQPALFAIEVALAALFRSWGVVPDLLIGHSVGEIAAAHLAGILDLDSAARLVARRGRVMQEATGHGTMVSAALTELEALQAIAGFDDRLSLAAVNDPGQVVLSGDTAALDTVVERLRARGVDCRSLRVRCAFHSPQMDPLREALVRELDGIAPARATIPMISSVTGERIAGDELTAAYWGDNLRKTVRLAQAIAAARASGHTIFVEIGPHPVLSVNIQQTLAAIGEQGHVLPTLRRQRDERVHLLEALGALAVSGARIDWERLFPEGGRVVALPSYPWQRERCWFEPSTKPRAAAPRVAGHPLMGSSIASSLHEGTHLWQRALTIADAPYLAEHRVQGAVVFPGAGYVEMALAACAEVLDTPDPVLVDVAISRALLVPEHGERLLQVVVTEDAPGEASFHVASRAEGEKGWQRHASGKARLSGGEGAPRRSTARALRAPEGAAARAAAHPEQMRRWQIDLGPAFHGIVALWEEEGEARGWVQRPAGLDDTGYRLHPAMLDACIRVASGLLGQAAEGERALPVGAARVHLVPLAPEARREIGVSARRCPEADADAREGSYDITLFAKDGSLVGTIEGLRLKRVPAASLHRDALDECVYEVAFRKVNFTPDTALPEGAWIVFADRSGVGAALAGLLRSRGRRCVRVFPGAAYERVEPDLYRLDPSSADDHDRLLREALGNKERCAGAIHLWSLDAEPIERTTVARLRADLTRGSVSATSLAQALVRCSGQEAPRLFLVTRGAQDTGEPEATIAVAQAPLWGLGRTLALEHPELRCTRVDLDPEPRDEDTERLFRELASTDGETELALRRGGRYAARVVRGQLPQGAPAVIRSDATYLVTGGLGGLGLGLARWLVNQGARRLVLAGRRGPTEEAARALRALEEAGATIACVQADVSIPDDMERLLAVVEGMGAPLRGVLHLSAVLDDHGLLEQSEETYQRVFGPKALGALLLHARTLDKALDVFVMYSSAASLLGSPGQANYAAANAFLDALSRERRRSGRPSLSVQWGAFTEVGLAAAQPTRSDALARRGIRGLAPEEGQRALERLLGAAKAEAAIVRFDPDAWIASSPGAAASPFLSELRRAAPPRGARTMPARIQQELADAEPAARLPLLVEHVIAQARRVLRLDARPVDPSAPFTTLGIDSLMSLELRRHLEASLGLALPAMILFTYPDAAALAQHLLDRLDQRASSDAAASATSAAEIEAPIPRVARDASGIAPVSSGQGRLWFLDRLAPGTALYHLRSDLRLLGPLDRAALQRSADALVARHASLRTTFTEVDGHPAAVLAPLGSAPIEVVDLRALPADRRQEEIARRSAEHATAPFDLARGPLSRLLLLSIQDEEHVLLWTQHHILSDAWSCTVLLAELARLYRALVEGRSPDLPLLPIDYADYAAFQQAALQGEACRASLAWWNERLSGLPRLDLPITKPAPAPTNAGDAVNFTLSPALTAGIEALAAQAECTLFVTLLSAWVALLHRYAGQDDFPVGIVSAGRSRHELQGIVGFFVNTLVLRCDTSGTPSFTDLMRRMRTAVVDALTHDDAPFDEVVRVTGAPRGRDLTPLYQASFVLESIPLPALEVPGSRWTMVLDKVDGSVEGTAKNDLGLTLIRLPEGLRGTVEFATDLFDRSSIERMVGHLEVLLRAVVDDPGQTLADVPLLTAAEQAAIAAWSGTGAITAPARCIHEWFEEQARKTPDAVAVEHGDARLSYAELDAQANQLAHHLRDLGVGPEVRVGLFVERSPAMLVGLWAILKAGGAYVPIDPLSPAERLAFLLADARAPVLLTQASLAEKLPPHGAAVVRLDTDAPLWSARPVTATDSGCCPDSAMYVIYTSGSTGQPKGVVVEHRSVAALLSGILAESRYEAPCRVLHRASLAFDVSVLEIIGPLLAGGCILLAPAGAAGADPGLLASLIRRRGVTYADLPPALLGPMLLQPDFRDAERLRVVTVGGEAPDPKVITEFLRSCRAALWNNYGPTEATVEATSWPASRYLETGRIRVGRPLPGYRVHVLDQRGGVVPVSIPGELCISGVGVARGYLGRPQLTAARFVPDPFSSAPSARMYRTGDLARLCEDGEIELLGRIDRQIKLRGFRIELEEIESTLSASAMVRSCAVVVREDTPGEKRLVAYVIPAYPSCTPVALRELLRARLPEPMIPAAFVLLIALPLTPNGKIDRAALPAPDRSSEEPGAAARVLPRTPAERDVALLWEQILGVQPIGIHDDFFAMGGHSMLAIRLAAAIEHRFQRAFPLAQVLARRTVAEMAEALFPIGSKEGVEHSALESDSPLVMLRGTGARPPLFCIQPTGTTALCYTELTRALGADQPVVGLETGIFDEHPKHLETVESMAAYYLSAVREILPEGPYRFGGWSFGGVVAFEMARQLEGAGLPVDHVVLMDTLTPSNAPYFNPTLPEQIGVIAQYVRAQGIDLSPEEMRALDPEVARARIAQRIEEAGWFPAGRAQRFVDGLFHNIGAHYAALRRYQPRPYGGVVTLVRARDRDAHNLSLPEPDYDWKSVCVGVYRVEFVRGTHGSMVYPPYVGDLARCVRNILDGRPDEP